MLISSLVNVNYSDVYFSLYGRSCNVPTYSPSWEQENVEKFLRNSITE
ncbi:MAG: hypothetical protein F6K39_30175 [Okeania sp. SIO3B3]|nr:hypothetical protein [Okeania sp. SIO3B3]